MGFSINTNIASMMANLNLNNANSTLTDSLAKMSSGSNFSSSAYDASGLSIANQHSTQVSSLGQAIQNSNDSIGMLQIADGGMSGISDNIEKIRTLTLQASNATLNDSNRAMIQKEIDSLMKSSDQIANTTSYNGKQLLNGSVGSLSTQTGANSGENQTANLGDVRMSSLLANINITNKEGRDAALESVDNALKSIGEFRSEIGSSQNALMSNVRNISLTQVNTASAESQMRDLDFALESANFSKANIMAQTGSFVQAQANANKANLAGLLG